MKSAMMFTRKNKIYSMTVEQFAGGSQHKPGATFVINHGDIGSKKFPKIMFPAPNPIEFYLYSAFKHLLKFKSQLNGLMPLKTMGPKILHL